jgi:hypothetical protein
VAVGGGSSGSGAGPVKPAPVLPPVKPAPVLPPVKPAPVRPPVKPAPVRPPVIPVQPAPDDSAGSGDDHGSGDGGSPGGPHDNSDDGDDRPDPPAKPVRPPWCLDRSDCSSRPAHHQRPHRPRHQDCDDDHEQRSARRGKHDRKTGVRGNATDQRAGAGRATDRPPADHDQLVKKISIRTAKAARSDSRRRSAVTERPQNVRPARTADRTHNSNRNQPFVTDRGEGTQTTTATRAYRGSHRAERMHRADDHAGAQHRSSRVGRHHTDHPRDTQDHQQNRW